MSTYLQRQRRRRRQRRLEEERREQEALRREGKGIFVCIARFGESGQLGAVFGFEAQGSSPSSGGVAYSLQALQDGKHFRQATDRTRADISLAIGTLSRAINKVNAGQISAESYPESHEAFILATEIYKRRMKPA